MGAKTTSGCVVATSAQVERMLQYGHGPAQGLGSCVTDSSQPLDRSQLFARIGGEPSVRRLVDTFYDLMDSLPEARGLRGLHPLTLDDSRDKLHWFLVGWMGGPQLYTSRFGHPRLRARHLPFPIGVAERDAWLRCMNDALATCIDDPPARALLKEALTQLADHMRNQPHAG